MLPPAYSSSEARVVWACNTSLTRPKTPILHTKPAALSILRNL